MFSAHSVPWMILPRLLITGLGTDPFFSLPGHGVGHEATVSLILGLIGGDVKPERMYVNMVSRLEEHLNIRKKMRKFRAIVVGVFEDSEHTIWSIDTKAYGSVKDFLQDNSTDDRCRDYLADELKIPRDDLDSYLEAHDDAKEMHALIKILLYIDVNIAIKGFTKYRDAVSFLSLLEQLGYQVPPDSAMENVQAAPSEESSHVGLNPGPRMRMYRERKNSKN